MFRKHKVDPHRNWWEVRNWKKAQRLIHKQVKTALSGHEFEFFIEHSIGEVFSWSHLDNWLSERSVRFDGPSQFNGLMCFQALTDEMKDYVHYRQTRDASIFALHQWSVDHGDGRLIGCIDLSQEIGVVDLEWFKRGYVRDTRSEWKPGHAKIGRPPVVQYFVNKKSTDIAGNVILNYKFNQNIDDYVYSGSYVRSDY